MLSNFKSQSYKIVSEGNAVSNSISQSGKLIEDSTSEFKTATEDLKTATKDLKTAVSTDNKNTVDALNTIKSEIGTFNADFNEDFKKTVGSFEKKIDRLAENISSVNKKLDILKAPETRNNDETQR